VIVPQALPVHPAPATDEATDHDTGAFAPDESCAKNCCVLGAPPVAAMKRYSGATVVAVAFVPDETVIVEVAVCDGAATLVATTETGF
jgi:hypothetical protein